MNSPLSSNSWIGRLLGDNHRYRLEKSLGGGGMGEVFLATDTRIGKEVALKLLKDKWLASGEMKKRFEREIAVCAALQSEHIIEISDSGVTSEGFPFYVMEYLRGQTLRQLVLREKQLSPEQTVNIMAQVCEGLQLAHEGVIMQRDGNNSNEIIKVIHRDLKPDNIFLLPREFGEWVKILDFGIAKIHKKSSEQTNLTQRFIGTFRYSSPEQIQNDKNIDGRSDIYSLGIILYEMLSAVDPFGLSIDRNKVSESSWLHAHGYKPPLPLTSVPGCEHISSELEAVVLKCLQKRRIDRFSTVGELREALQATIKPKRNTNNIERKTIISPQSQQAPPSSDDQTVSKPAETRLPSQPQIANLQPQPSSNTNDETISKPLESAKPSQPEIANSQSWQNQNYSQHIPQNHSSGRSLPSNQFQEYKPSAATSEHSTPNLEEATPEGTIYQPRNPAAAKRATPEAKISQPHNPAPAKRATPEGTIYQPRNPAAKRATPEGKIYQPRNPAAKRATPEAKISQPHNPAAAKPATPEGTIYQPRNPAAAKSATPEGTIYQPRNPTAAKRAAPEGTINQPRNPVAQEAAKPEGTINQPRQLSNPSQQQPFDGRIMQSQQNPISRITPEKTTDRRATPNSPPRGQNRLEATIYQPKKNNQNNQNNHLNPQKNNLSMLQIIAINLVISSIFFVAYFFFSREIQRNEDRPSQVEKNQIYLMNKI